MAKISKTQFDSYTNQQTTFKRLFKNTKWTEKELKGKRVLEVGSGAGRFTEIFKKTGCKLSSVDLSDAIFVNAKNNQSKNINFLRLLFIICLLKKNILISFSAMEFYNTFLMVIVHLTSY